MFILNYKFILKKILPKRVYEFARYEKNKIKNLVNRSAREKSLIMQNNNYKHQINKLKKENTSLKKLNDFINFQEFLSNSYVSPVINAPFTSQDKRVFAFMDHLSKYLVQNISIENKPLVSIIMPTYNRENIIQNAIDSVLNQNYENWELLVIDDGSSDNTLELLNNINNDKIKVISYGENKGHSFARNTGLKNAKGDIIMYLDSDNEWDPRYIETMVGAFIELPDAVALYSGQLLYSEYNSKPYAIRFGSFNKPLLHNRNYIDLNCFCHKKCVFNVIGGFDEELIKLVDFDYILRMSNRFKIYSVPVLLSKYYEDPNVHRVTDIPFKYFENVAKIFEKNIIPINEYESLSHKVSIIIPSYESLNELKKTVFIQFYHLIMVKWSTSYCRQ